MDRPDEPTARVFIGKDISQADLVKGLLLANGIPAVIQDEGTVAMLDGMVSMGKGVAVHVPRSVLEAARAILEEARTVGDLDVTGGEEE
ncbi:MAG: putative signal transducing protein [Planctomycetota bacterium]|jgi:hypothetical protein